MGASATVAAGVAAASAGTALSPEGPLAAALGLVSAVAMAMAWVDKRIDKRITEHEEVESERAGRRDAELLRKVEEMLRR